ncbi:hypothetical protein [Lentzea guizhouensis]|nr:hypothetical protein [Lentzea guizhouensis]
MGQLCISILDHLDHRYSSHRHSIWFAAGNHLALVVADLFLTEPSEFDMQAKMTEYAFTVEEFNWIDLVNTRDQRFHLAQVTILDPTASQHWKHSGVTMQPGYISCSFCREFGPILRG